MEAGAVYCATKYAVNQLTDGVDVNEIVVRPTVAH